MQERENMTTRQKELIARNILIVLSIMLMAMFVSTFIWGYWL